MIKRLKRLWQLSKKDKTYLDEFMKLSDKEIMEIPDEETSAVFISEGTIDEFKEFETKEKFGIKKLFGINNE